jgi:signal recognition particle GTPase
VKVAEVNTLMNKFAQRQQVMKKFAKMQTMPGMR